MISHSQEWEIQVFLSREATVSAKSPLFVEPESGLGSVGVKMQWTWITHLRWHSSYIYLYGGTLCLVNSNIQGAKKVSFTACHSGKL